MRAESARLAEAARRSQLSYLAEVLATETEDRAERRRQRSIHEARFPRIKRLADFDVGATPSISADTLATPAPTSMLASP